VQNDKRESNCVCSGLTPCPFLVNFVGEGFDEALEPTPEDHLCIGRRVFKGDLHVVKGIFEKEGTDVRIIHFTVVSYISKCLPEKVPDILVARCSAAAKEGKGVDKLPD